MIVGGMGVAGGVWVVGETCGCGGAGPRVG